MPRPPSSAIVMRRRAGGALGAAAGMYQVYRANGGQLPTTGQLYRFFRRNVNRVRELWSNRPQSQQLRRGRGRSSNNQFINVRRGGIGPMRRLRGFSKKRRIGYRKKKGKHNVGKRGMMKRLWKEMHAPMKMKVHQAFATISAGHGLRTWQPFLINGIGLINSCVNRAPTSGFFWEGQATYGTAGTQTPFSKCRALHMCGGYYNFQCQNRHNWDMHLKVYECVARHDINLDVANIQANYFRAGTSFGSYSYSTNLAPHTPGLADNLATGVDRQLSFTPYLSSGFCSDFKIVKTRNYKITANDYVSFKVKLPNKVLDRSYIDRLGTDSLNCLKGFSKVLLFTFVGGPVDTGLLTTDHKQSTSAPSLAVQYDLSCRFYFERSSYPLYTIASSNATSFERDSSYGSNFTTATTTYEIPATETVQTVGGSSATNAPGDNVLEDNMQS